jgi:uncharacterized protein
MRHASYYKSFSNSTTYKLDAKENDYLYVQKSQIPASGNGLFTAIPIYKDEVIAIFDGEILSAKVARQRALFKNDSYFISLPDGKILDSMHFKCFAKFANDTMGFVKTNFKINSRITLNENGNVCLTATKKILAGEEIFCKYGKEYWRVRKLNNRDKVI